MFRVDIALILDHFAQISLSLKAHVDRARSNRVQTVFYQRDILGEPGEHNPAFVVDFGHYLCCASKKLRTVEKEKERGTLDCSCVSDIQNNTTKEERRGVFFSSHPRGKDGFIPMALWMFTGFSLAFSSQSRGRSI